MKKHFYFISGLFCVSVFIYVVILYQIYNFIEVIKYIGLSSATIGLIYSIVLSEKFNKLINSLRNEAMHDGMTGLLNHKFFEKRLDEEIERSERYKEKITLLFLDLDNFKRINDTYGHQFGDYVLKVTASIIEDNVRNIDIVSRYGGEEFTLILPETTLEQGFAVAERIRELVATQTYVDSNEKPFTVTISLGLSIYDGKGEITNKDLINEADSYRH